MDRKERGQGGLFRGKKYVNQRTVKAAPCLFTVLLIIRKGLFLSRTSGENQEPVSMAKDKAQHPAVTFNNSKSGSTIFHSFINSRHNPAPLTAEAFIYWLWGELEHNFHFVQPLFCSCWGLKIRFQEWLYIHWRSKHSPHHPEPVVPAHCTHQGQQPRHKCLVDVGCSQPLVRHLPFTLIRGHLATTCQPNGHQQHLLFPAVGSRQCVNSW